MIFKVRYKLFTLLEKWRFGLSWHITQTFFLLNQNLFLFLLYSERLIQTLSFFSVISVPFIRQPIISP